MALKKIKYLKRCPLCHKSRKFFRNQMTGHMNSTGVWENVNDLWVCSFCVVRYSPLVCAKVSLIIKMGQAIRQRETEHVNPTPHLRT